LQRKGRDVEAMFIMDDGEEGFTFWATPNMRKSLNWLQELPLHQP
jgi:hypothetical protein